MLHHHAGALVRLSAVRHQADHAPGQDGRRDRAEPLHDQHEATGQSQATQVPCRGHRHRRPGRPSRQPDLGVRQRLGGGQGHRTRALRPKVINNNF